MDQIRTYQSMEGRDTLKRAVHIISSYPVYYFLYIVSSSTAKKSPFYIDRIIIDFIRDIEAGEARKLMPNSALLSLYGMNIFMTNLFQRINDQKIKRRKLKQIPIINCTKKIN